METKELTIRRIGVSDRYDNGDFTGHLYSYLHKYRKSAFSKLPIAPALPRSGSNFVASFSTLENQETSMTIIRNMILALAGTAFFTAAAEAKELLITGAKSSGDAAAFAQSGSMQTYATVTEAIGKGAIAGGDTVYFTPIDHGGLVLRDLDFASPVIFTSQPGTRAHFQFVTITKSRNITIRSVDIWPTSQGDGMGAVFRALESTANIVAEDLDVRSVEKAALYPRWTKAQWLANKRNGALLQGTNSIVRSSRFTGVFNAVAVQGANSLIEGNTVTGFSGDGLRALGDDSTIRGNSVNDCVSVSGAHNDGIQSWSTDEANTLFLGVLKGITLENNQIREWSSSVVSPLRCSLQGIFIAGYLEDLKIRNNVILVTAWHGVAVYGGSDIEITHNTVVHPRGLTDRKPWIRIEPGRDGRISSNILIANNITTAVKSSKSGVQLLKTANNMTPTNMTGEFSSLLSGDVELSMTARSADAANPTYTTTNTDFRGDPRIKGKAPDAGAIESR